MLFWHTKSYFEIRTVSENGILTLKSLVFDIRTELENAILIFLFWHSNWIGKSYFDIQNPILTFKLSRKIVILHSISYFDIQTESENRIVTFGKCYFDIRNPILTFKLIRKIVFRLSKSYFDIRTES